MYCTPNSCADATSADVAMMIVVSNLFTISLPFYSFITILPVQSYGDLQECKIPTNGDCCVRLNH
jgi:hypothetical protein